MSEFILNAKPYLECASFLGTIVLSFIAFYGLKQIQLLKVDMLNRSERSAKEKAIEVVSTYFNEIIPAVNKHWRNTKSKGLDVYKGEIGNFSSEEFEGKSEKTLKGIEKFKLDSWLEMFNKQEALAAAFVTGVADEETGFKSIGLIFVDNIHHHYDLYSMCQNQASKGKAYFPNTLELYKVWAPRFTAKELEKARSSIDQKLKNLTTPSLQKLKPEIE